MRTLLLIRSLPKIVREQGFKASVANILIHLRSEICDAVRVFALRIWHHYYFRNWIERRRNRRMLETARSEQSQRNGSPLVSVLIPTYNRGKILVERAVASVLEQTYQNFEIVIVGDHCTDNTQQLIRDLNDTRIRFCNLPEKTKYPESSRDRWMVAGVGPRNKALELCSGDWIAPLDDDDEFSEDHIEALLNYAREHGHEMVYGKVMFENRPNEWIELGSYPLAFGKLCHISVMYSSRLKFKYSVDSWKYGEPADWNMWRRMREAGVRIGFVSRVVGRYYLEGARRTALEKNLHARCWCNLNRCFGISE